jgi:hypothetical protein
MRRLRLLKPDGPHGIPLTFYRPDRDGVTFSLLTKWKDCRERAKLHLQGWTSARISLSMLYGQIIHAVLERIYGDIQLKRLRVLPTQKYVDKHLKVIGKEWRAENPKASTETLQDLELALMLVYVVVPIYFTFWNKDLTTIKWQALEHEFKLPIPDLKTFVRGKMDGRYRSSLANNKKSYLFETKSKSRLGEMGESNLTDILPFELQVNTYFGAMWADEGQPPGGLCYNIIRRPNLQRRKAETFQMFQRRIEVDVRARPEYYFIRLRMDVDARDLKRQGLEQHAMIEDFLAWYHGKTGHYKNSNQCENKYGTCEFIKVCSAGDYHGLYKRPRVFGELEDY